MYRRQIYFIFVGIVIVLLLDFFYIFRSFFNAHFWKDFASNFLATLIGVAVGIPIAFWINRKSEVATHNDMRGYVLVMLMRELLSVWYDESPEEGGDEAIEKFFKSLPDLMWQTMKESSQLHLITDLGYRSLRVAFPGAVLVQLG